ncbi:MAG TPA: hypothetical protein P5555_20450 [Candidatus Paceibacterota bacterium]|nr:hypothetical protein [Verrucomicrobiota bacterium]HOX04575.1 hypothetical protein [Verrucomicrobiota bacterium]HRZ47553.1 hypothetical protein [Candidatus Paceibacterota bacterium]HRZ92281.1 hypothetical protein [Candidatus Paceibacterota bacterium]
MERGEASADTWFKKRAGHTTGFWVLDKGIIVRIRPNREPYEMALLGYTVPDKLPGHVSGPAAKDLRSTASGPAAPSPRGPSPRAADWAAFVRDLYGVMLSSPQRARLLAYRWPLISSSNRTHTLRYLALAEKAPQRGRTGEVQGEELELRVSGRRSASPAAFQSVLRSSNGHEAGWIICSIFSLRLGIVARFKA